MEAIKVVLFEDNKHLRESLQILLTGTPGFVCCAAYPDVNDLVRRIESDSPDVALMDIEMPGMNGIEATTIIKERFPKVQVLIQTVFYDDEYIFKAICAGASGYILKTTTPAGYVQALTEVHSGGSPMTPGIARRVLELFRKNTTVPEKGDYHLSDKETEVLQQLVSGKSYKMIGDALGISYDTVKTHMKSIYAKLHVSSNTEAVVKAIRDKLV